MNADFPFIFRARIKELLEINQMTIQDLTNRSGLPRSVVFRILHTDSLLIEKEYVNAIINGFGLTYEEFFLPRRYKKEAIEVINCLPQRLINFIGDENNILYIDLAAYFKASGYLSTLAIARIVDHWYDSVSDNYIEKQHPKRINPIKIPFDLKNKKSFIGESGKRPESLKKWLFQYKY